MDERQHEEQLTEAERKRMLKKRYQSQDTESRAITFKEVHGFDPDDLE